MIEHFSDICLWVVCDKEICDRVQIVSDVSGFNSGSVKMKDECTSLLPRQSAEFCRRVFWIRSFHFLPAAALHFTV